MINAAPAHPQTLGKLERFHRTLKEWLHDEGPPLDLEHLQLLLDRFRAHYNSERPDQGIGNQTPAERYLPGRSIEQPLGELTLAEADKAPIYPPHAQLRKVDGRGIVGYDRLRIIIPAATPAPPSASSRSANSSTSTSASNSSAPSPPTAASATRHSATGAGGPPSV